MDWQKIISDLAADALTYAPKIALALVVIIVGFWIAKRISKTMKKIMKKRDTDEALISFGSDLVNILIKALVVISAAGIVGIETTSFIAILGAAGLAIGLALQGSLGNFAGGVLILIFKPFRVGDLIDAQGHIGHVRAINVFVTTLESPDSKTVILPNGPFVQWQCDQFVHPWQTARRPRRGNWLWRKYPGSPRCHHGSDEK